MKRNLIEQGFRIRGARLAARMTQRELGDLLGVGPTTVSGWERGNGCPSVKSARGIARILGLTGIAGRDKGPVKGRPRRYGSGRGERVLNAETQEPIGWYVGRRDGCILILLDSETQEGDQ